MFETMEHDGHRERMRGRFLKNGLESLSSHEVAELLLFYAMPRKNVNKIAHALIDRFGSVRNLLNADEDEIMAVEGVGASTAKFLRAFGDAVRAYREEPDEETVVIRTRADGANYARHLFGDDKRPQIWMSLIGNHGDVILSTRIYAGAMWLTDKTRDFIMGHALRYNANYIVLFARRGFHIGGILPVDRRMVDELTKMLESVKVKLMDYLVVCPDRVVSLRSGENAGQTNLKERIHEGDIMENWLDDIGDVENVKTYRLKQTEKRYIRKKEAR